MHPAYQQHATFAAFFPYTATVSSGHASPAHRSNVAANEALIRSGISS
jgi:hypothetical protein